MPMMVAVLVSFLNRFRRRGIFPSLQHLVFFIRSSTQRSAQAYGIFGYATCLGYYALVRLMPSDVLMRKTTVP